MMPKDNITSAEERSPASVGRSLRREGPVTATGKSLLAQRTIKKVRVLQETLYRAAKENLRRTFGVLYDKVYRWEVLWEAWYRVRRNRGAPGVDGRTIEAIKAQGEVEFIRVYKRSFWPSSIGQWLFAECSYPRGEAAFVL